MTRFAQHRGGLVAFSLVLGAFYVLVDPFLTPGIPRLVREVTAVAATDHRPSIVLTAVEPGE